MLNILPHSIHSALTKMLHIYAYIHVCYIHMAYIYVCYIWYTIYYIYIYIFIYIYLYIYIHIYIYIFKNHFLTYWIVAIYADVISSLIFLTEQKVPYKNGEVIREGRSTTKNMEPYIYVRGYVNWWRQP